MSVSWSARASRLTAGGWNGLRGQCWRDDAVTDALLAAGGSRETFGRLVDVLDRHEARRWAFNLLDLVTELGQQELEQRGEPRTWDWPPGKDKPITAPQHSSERNP